MRPDADSWQDPPPEYQLHGWRATPRSLEEQVRHVVGGLELVRVFGAGLDELFLDGLAHDLVETAEVLDELIRNRFG